jgi:predicted NBD/HSP70 family sugar kinase
MSDNGAAALEAQGLLVSVDFTADLLRLLLATVDGEVVDREAWALPELADEEAWAWELGGRISTLFAKQEASHWALGIGLACPGTVDGATGVLVRSNGQPAWDGLSVVAALRRNIDAPIVALNRTAAALQAEANQGVAVHVADVLYVSLRGVPEAAMLAGGRLVGGHTQSAGALPALPAFEADAEREPSDIERLAGVLADAAALLDPELVILEGAESDLRALGPLLQGVIDEVAPGPTVVAAQLGEIGPLLGAMLAAGVVAYEGERRN